MSWHCLWQSCLLQNSTGIPAPFETFLWLALRRGPIFGAVGLHAFCLPSLRTLHVYVWFCVGKHCVVYIYISRAQPFATVRANSVWPCLWEVLQRWFFLEVSDVWLLRFAWQAWHFVTFRRVLQRVESRFAWQAQYFCDVFRRCVAVFVAGAALWACPSSFFVAGAAL